MTTLEFLRSYRDDISKDLHYNLFDVCRINLDIIYRYYDNEMGKDNYDVTRDYNFGVYFLNYLNSVYNFINYHVHKVDNIEIKKYHDLFKKSLDDSVLHENSYCLRAIELLKETYEDVTSNLELYKYHEVILKRKLLYKGVNLLELFVNSFLEILKYDSEINRFLHHEIIKCEKQK